MIKRKEKQNTTTPPRRPNLGQDQEKRERGANFSTKLARQSKDHSSSFSPLKLSANTLQTNQKSENLSKQEEKKEISKKKGRGKEEGGRGRPKQAMQPPRTSLTCA